MPIMQSVFYLPIQINVLRTWLSCVQVDTSLENITYCAFFYMTRTVYIKYAKNRSQKNADSLVSLCMFTFLNSRSVNIKIILVHYIGFALPNEK